ncbi:G-protein alpha subunit [Dichomitus squalens]|uniref:G-protein alpha subunit n=2 Tax=Dichomitus squalens TaxID=114155 RepID=A0A4Q9NL42_9APHY|nr:G-protein alpha subunit [Dichomitus squalens LYAD-421 SS1]EJF60188.1 G-protein alpha subunit [Dichomitus squalens LYAD-421 SS1]TBU40522.1 G-protein alpha subunit [Dichomitus squalens]TBU59980.1 G-protein alpha subunit [Dichomitus squalens]
MGVQKRPHDDDPLSRVLAPPPNETAEERETRLRLEAEARQISDKIDEQLKAERAALKKNRPVKVLLLGQSESGKSTTLKNFQLTYCRDQWEAERASWCMVIQLNLVRGINTILDILSEEMAGVGGSGGAPPPAVDSDVSDDDDGPGPGPARTFSPSSSTFSGKHRLLKLRLTPLRTVQRDLELRIGIQAGADISDHFVPASPPGSPVLGATRKQEFFVRSATSWKQLQGWGAGEGEGGGGGGAGRKSKDIQMRETADILAGCAEDMKAIWEDATVREMLLRKGVRMETTPGFFLNDIDRIASRSYQPSDDDVVRARLRTLGVQEHKIKFASGPAAGSEWCIYDVGGSRTQRIAWYPYFDDCDAIIFLAPISCFDERLAEDRRVNRLEDSFMLWKAVVSSKLLAKTSIVLFLNKCDLLEQKLLNGVRIKEYVHSYGDRPNDLEHATKYFAQHFRDILRKHSPEPRPFRVHMTSVVDTKATAVTLSVVEEGILRDHLTRADLL